MSLGYKDDLERCIEYLWREKNELVNNAAWDQAIAERYEDLDSYCKAIRGALEVIEYYDERDRILKVQQGESFLNKLDSDWYNIKTSRINEQLGIGFTKSGET